MRQTSSPFLAIVKGTGLRLSFVYVALALVTLAIARAPFDLFGMDGGPGLQIAAAAAGVSVGALLAFIVSRALTKPLRSLAETANEIARGNLDARVDVACACDIGVLADSMRGMVANLRASTARIADLADFDAATGLPKAHRFLARVDAAARLNGPGGALLMITVTNLRRITETFGHETAEALLSAGADRLLAASSIGTREANRARALDAAHHELALLSRVGAEDFALMLPGVSDPVDLAHLAGYLHVAMNRPLTVDGRKLTATLAIGIARFPEDAGAGAELLRLSALACGHAGRLSGEQKTMVYAGWMREALAERDMLEHELRRAIDSDELQVHYQPKVYASDWSLSGVEALVRWRHTERGLIMPADFIPVAEETGLIVDLGLFVIDKAVAQCAAWARSGRLIEMSINVSPAQFRHPDFSRQVLSAIARHGCPPTLVTFEITETMAQSDVAVMERHIAPLQQAGIRFAIDDFGSGYSNFARLSKMRFDVLKVDRSLVAGLETDGSAREVSRAIVQLGKALGCRIVAEGAETPGQVAAASTLGCDEIQGFYVSHPMTIEDFEAWQMKRGNSNLARIVKSIFGPDFGEPPLAEPVTEPEARRAAG
jgi:EAL domain-containing protein (putative c-di-GMP-specific phosphodiesterase class I)/GGDEF domain-containing protein